VGANSFTGTSTSVEANKASYGATTFNYDVRLILDSSFTGKDLLRTVLRAGDFDGTAYFSGLTALETAFQSPASDNVVAINRLFYNFPVGKDFSVTAGAKVRVDDAGMLGMWPSVYPADTVLDFFTYAGAPGAYDLDGLGAGFGATYSNVLGIEGVTLSSNYVSINGNEGDAGLMTDASSSVSVTQLGYTGGKFPVIGGSAWGIAGAYTYSQNNSLFIATPLAFGYGATGTTNSVGVSGYWVPENTGWIPSVSTGWGTSSFEDGAGVDSWSRAQSWYVGLQWPDTFVKGNDLGMAVGQAPFVTNTGTDSVTPDDSNYMWEWWYKFQVTDNITVTPAIYYISNYEGQVGKGTTNASSNVFGGLLKTTFKF